MMMILVLYRQRSDPAVAVLAGTPSGRDQPRRHLMDRRRLGVPHGGPGRGRSTLGRAEEQAEDELRETESQCPVLLRQEHHPQDARQALRLSLRLRHGPASLLFRRAAVRSLRPDAATSAAWRSGVGLVSDPAA